MITSDQITGIVRAGLAVAGGFFVSKGTISSSTFDWISGSVLSAVATGWSIWNNRPASLAASAQAIPGVDVHVTASAPADVKRAVADAKSGG
jgi:hypothetical protein